MAEFDPDAYLAKEEKRKGFDPDAYLAKTAPETAVQSFGRGAASLADTVLGIPGGIVSPVVYAGSRALGRTPEQSQATAQQFEWGDKVGKMAGVTGTPGYENAPLRAAGRMIGETLGENVIQPTAEMTGIPEQDVANMLNSLAVGAAPVAGKIAAPVGRAVKATVQAPVDVARGALGSATGAIARPGEVPTAWQSPSSRIPLKETYIPAEGLEQLRTNPALTPADVSKPTTQLAQTIPERGAMAISGGQIPVQGQAMRAFGERLGETYRNPMTALADVGTAALTGVPFFTAGKAIGAGARALGDYTMSRKGFSQLSPAERAAIDAGQNPWAAGPVVPEAPPMAAPMASPVVNQPTPPQLTYSPTKPTIYVAPEGVAGTDIRAVNQAGIQQKYPSQPVVPESIPTAPAVPVQETVIQKAQRVMGDKYKAPKPAPVAAPEPAPVAAPEPAPVAAPEPAPAKAPKPAPAKAPKPSPVPAKATEGSLRNPLKPKEAKAFIEEKTKNNEAYDIYYKKGSVTVNERFMPEGETFKLDPSIKMYRVKNPASGPMEATGTYKDNIPARAIINSDNMTVEIYTTVNGKEQLYKKFDIPKGKKK